MRRGERRLHPDDRHRMPIAPAVLSGLSGLMMVSAGAYYAQSSSDIFFEVTTLSLLLAGGTLCLLAVPVFVINILGGTALVSLGTLVGGAPLIIAMFDALMDDDAYLSWLFFALLLIPLTGSGTAATLIGAHRYHWRPSLSSATVQRPKEQSRSHPWHDPLSVRRCGSWSLRSSGGRPQPPRGGDAALLSLGQAVRRSHAAGDTRDLP